MAEAAADQHTVRVAVRVRPLSEKEIREGGEVCVDVDRKNATITLKQDSGEHLFAFDNIFGLESTQPEVFEQLGVPLLDKAFEGYNSTIFAYGQTGSGKTHTMMSDRKSDDRGLIPRISDDLFKRVTTLSTDNRKFLVCCSFLEIYNEIVYDLLAPRGKQTQKTGLEIREGKGVGVYVKDLQEIVVDSSEKLQKLIDQGFDCRATASTAMNQASSRSHCLFIIKMHQKDDQNASNNNFSKINLVDLAGSERANRTGAQGDTLKEGANINKSLSALGNVINALSLMSSGNKKVFIPYRNSKLTRVLQESLGGNALTTMMAACSPSKTNADETLSTLNYAKRAKTIKVNATKNDEAEHIAKLEEEVEALRAKLAEQASGVADTGRYQAQIDEMEKFMKQTWEEKEKATQRHEEERKALEVQHQKNIEKANAERARRLKLLEEKGDVELSMQELQSLGTNSGSASGTWTQATANWHPDFSKVLAKQQRVTAQCRAVSLCKDAVVHDIASWCEQAKVDDDGGAAGRMLLQQADRKAASMLRELENLNTLERELEDNMATLLPDVRRIISGVETLCGHEQQPESPKAKEEGGEKEEKSEGKEEVSEEFVLTMALIGRQLETHQSKAWGEIGEFHRGLGKFMDSLNDLVGKCGELGSDTAPLVEEIGMEIGGSSASAGPEDLGQEALAARARPLGVSSGEVSDSAMTASSNAEAAPCGRLLNGIGSASDGYGGWCPAMDENKEYIEIDLGAPRWICGVGTQGRRPASGRSEQTRQLLTKVLEESDPIPPERVFKRPPVRLIHDVVVAVHTRHKAFEAATGVKDFTNKELDYRHLQNSNREAKVAFFEKLLGKANGALQAAGPLGQNVPPLSITPSEILGGKNTDESNRLLQLLCYLALQKKLGGGHGGLVSCGDQWVKKYMVLVSVDGTEWTAICDKTDGSALKLTGNADTTQVRYNSLGTNRPAQPVRYLRVQPLEWHGHPGMRLEIYGWVPGEEATTPTAKGDASASLSLSDLLCRLDNVNKKARFLKRAVELAHSAAVERWREAQRQEEERNQKELAEKTAVEQQLADALKKLEELRQTHHLLEDQLQETEQKLIDANTEKLKLEVDKERSETQCASLEEKLTTANDTISQEKEKVSGLEDKVSDLNNQAEDLQMQIGVLTEERDCARTREEELFDTLTAREEELMNTNEGYVYLTDNLHEVREELEEKIETRDRLIETLNERNQELSDEGLKLRQANGELTRKLSEAEKAVQDAARGIPTRFSIKAGSTGMTATTTASDPSDNERGYPERIQEKKEKKKKSKDGPGSGSEGYEEDFDDNDDEDDD